MPPDRVVFFDFDDTLSDQILFNLKYVRAIGEILAPLYGGDIEAWAKSGIDMLQALEDDYLVRFEGNPLSGYCAWLESIRVRSAGLLFNGMNLPPPPAARALALRTQTQALRRCNAAFAGVPETLSALTREGYRLFIASGQESEYLWGALNGMGIDHTIERCFGPDLIDCAKEGPEYYERVFAEVGVRGEDALVVDDLPAPIGWALEQGATVIQAKLSRERHHERVPGVAAVLTDFAALPRLIAQITRMEETRI
jgi:phosphoglycolate phosphatase-like HAD superfamily hydrolase